MSHRERTRRRAVVSSILLAMSLGVSAGEARAQCPVTELVSGLRFPLGIARSGLGNLLVAEAGTLGVSNSGRISIIDGSGDRRTLVDGLPSGTNDVGEPSGPAGLYLRGRTLFVAIGIGDVGIAGPFPGALLPNENPSSPLFSSILAIRFSVAVEESTAGFMLRPAQHQRLADSGRVVLSNGGGDRVSIELVADFPDLTPAPLETLPENQRGVNPFRLVALNNRIFVTDGGQNVVWEVVRSTGAFTVLAEFPQIPNPIGGDLPPLTDAVPTGLRELDGQLVVGLLSGFPFAQGSSRLEQVDPSSGAHFPLVEGLTATVDVLPLAHRTTDPSYLVVQHASESFFGGDGHLIHVRSDGERMLVADCLERPTSIARDGRTGTLYLTELVRGRVVTIRQKRWRTVTDEG